MQWFDQRVIERRFGPALDEFVAGEGNKINSRMIALWPTWCHATARIRPYLYVPCPTVCYIPGVVAQKAVWVYIPEILIALV